MAYYSYPPSSGAGGGISEYATFTDFPDPTTVSDGTFAFALDTEILYVSNGTSWIAIAGPGVALSIGTFDSGVASVKGAHIDSNALIMQSASASVPGLVNTGAQTLAGAKTFSTAPILSSLSASTALVLDGSKNIASLPYASINTAGALVQRDGSGNFAATTITANLTGTASGNPPNARLINTTAPLTGGGDLSADRTLAITQATTSTNGYLSSVDWNTFNGKQAAGNYITALTGDVTASGPGSVAASLVATSNATLTTLSALTTASALVSVGTITSGTWSATTIAVNKGGTGVTSVTTAAAATSWAGWDANKNMSANSFLQAYTTTATAAGTSTLTVGSTELQYFTGSTTQTVVLPVTSTLVLGQQFKITNNSSGVVTVQSSGANSVQAMAANTYAVFTCILTSGTTAASWSVLYSTGSAGITALTGDVTASGPGSAAATLAATSNATLTTLSALTTASSLVSVGTITSGTWSATTIAVNKGGTGITSGTSGGILGYTASGTLASSGALTASQLIIGGGAGVTPSTLAAGSQFQVLVMGASNPGYGQVNLASAVAVTGVLGTANGGVGANYKAPTTQKFTSGSGTYTTPAGVVWLQVEMIGGGGGGAAGFNSGGSSTQNGGNGGATTFGSSFLTANGGTGGQFATVAGGTATIGAGAAGTAIQGATGGGSTNNNNLAGINCPGATGASTPFGGGAPGMFGAAGQAAIANTGAGGGGGAYTSATSGADSGGGGAAGGYIKAVVAPVSASYAYAVGAAGTAGPTTGSTGGFAGGVGGSGYIIVTEHYV